MFAPQRGVPLLCPGLRRLGLKRTPMPPDRATRRSRSMSLPAASDSSSGRPVRRLRINRGQTRQHGSDGVPGLDARARRPPPGAGPSNLPPPTATGPGLIEVSSSGRRSRHRIHVRPSAGEFEAGISWAAFSMSTSLSLEPDRRFVCPSGVPDPGWKGSRRPRTFRRRCRSNGPHVPSECAGPSWDRR
jgi:hypothetical protein